MQQSTGAVTGDCGRDVVARPDDEDGGSEVAPRDVHSWFGLSYANYLVAPRAVLQSMPEAWQHRFTALLDEMHTAFGHLDWPSYSVKVLQCEPELITDYVDCECGGEDPDCRACDDGQVADSTRYETDEEVGYRDDPIPHYNRGRTVLTPRDGQES